MRVLSVRYHTQRGALCESVIGVRGNQLKSSRPQRPDEDVLTRLREQAVAVQALIGRLT